MTAGETETVLVRCPACGWESEGVEVVPEVVNGRWFAFQECAKSYLQHFNREHRPGPEIIVRHAEKDVADWVRDNLQPEFDEADEHWRSG